MGTSAPTPGGHLTVAQAADALGIKPWDVMRLIESGELQSLVLIDAASVEAAKENQ